MPPISPSSGPVAVTGASGYIGSWICYDLMMQGYNVRACVRDTSNPKKVAHLQAMNEYPILRGTLTLYQADLLVPGIGELVGGSIRENDYKKMKGIMESKNIEIDWYLDLRKYGSVPHGGFGLGFERLLLLVTGLSNIRDIIPYPRAPRSCLC